MTRWRPAAPGKPAGPKTRLLGYAPLFALSEVGLIIFFLQQRNLKQKFISLLKRFRISEDLDNDPEEIEQKLSGKWFLSLTHSSSSPQSLIYIIFMIF